MRISAPLVSRVVAKLCRKVWACKFFKIPAFKPYSLIILVMKNRDRRIFSSFKNVEFIFSVEKLCLIKRGEKSSSRASRYSRIAFLAFSVRYTTRNFPHFPRTANSIVFRFTSFLLRLVSSEIRNPVE